MVDRFLNRVRVFGRVPSFRRGGLTHPSDPNLVPASSIFGRLFYSGDGGGSWRKVRQEFTEVRSLAWMPSSSLFQ